MKKICSLLMVVSVTFLLFSSCEQKVEKTDPVSVIERLSQEVDKSCDTWDKAAWDDAADRLQVALNSLSQPIDTTQLNLTSALESLLMNARSHERQAIKMLQVLKTYENLKNADKEEQEDPDESFAFVGTIHDQPVTMNLDFFGNRVKGSYYYEKNGPNSKLTLTGTCKKGVIDLEEKNENDEITGRFHGTLESAFFNGTFTNSKGRELTFLLYDKDKAENENDDELYNSDFDALDQDVNEPRTTTANTQTSAAVRDAQIDAYENLVNRYIAAINKVVNGDMDALDEYNSLKAQVESFETKKGYSQAQFNRINRITQRYKDRLKEVGGL